MVRNQTWKKRLSAIALSAIMTISVGIPALADAPTGLPNQEGDGYVSLHNYISPTDIQDVYKVTLSIKGVPQKPRETRVAIVIDNSGSMNQDDGQKYWDSASIMNNQYDATDEFFASIPMPLGGQTVANRRIAYPLYPSPFMLAMTSPAFPGGSTITANSNYLKLGWGGNANPSQAVDFPFFGSYLNKYNSVWLPAFSRTTLAGASAQGTTTRLEAALNGAAKAVDVFLDAKQNPSAEMTSVGVVGFSSPNSAISDSYMDEKTYDIHGATLLMGAAVATYGYGDPVVAGDAERSITYSTRTPKAGTVLEQYDTGDAILGGVDPNAKKLATKILNRDLVKYMQNTLEPSTKVPTGAKTSIGTLAKMGMMSYDSAGKGKALLEQSLKKDFWHSMPDSQTYIYDSLVEAERMLFDTGAASGGLDLQTGVNKDGIRRFIIFLSDCGDNSQTPAFTSNVHGSFEQINKLKSNGVDFMVMGIDTEGGDGTEKSATKGIPGTGGSVDPATGLADTPVDSRFGKYAVWMATELKSYTTTLGSWADVEKNYTAANWTGITPSYEYIPPNAEMSKQIGVVFDEFVRKIVEFGTGAKADIKINNAFDVYQYPNKPLYQLINANKGAKVVLQGNSITWDLNTGVPLDNEVSLVFYVKINNKVVDADVYYNIIDSSVFSCTGPFKTANNPDASGVLHDDVTISISWPASKVASSKEAAPEAPTSKPSDPVLNDNTVPGFTSQTHAGAVLPMTGGNTSAAVTTATPEITKTESTITKDGKTQVSVSVKNGSDMYFQWQYQNKDKNWVNIGGANSSTYSLSKNFSSSKKYSFRCEIKNRAGRKFYSDTIDVTPNKTSTEKLVSGN